MNQIFASSSRLNISLSTILLTNLTLSLNIYSFENLDENLNKTHHCIIFAIYGLQWSSLISKSGFARENLLIRKHN